MKLPPAFTGKSNTIHAIVESPRGSGNKYTFDPGFEMFRLSKILPKGMVFPLHFGFVPSTKAEDGDPLDVLILMDEPSYPGSLIEAKVIGVIEARQTERNGDTMRNDRLIAAATASNRYKKFTLKSLNSDLLNEISAFFVNYNALTGKSFKPLTYGSARKGIQLIKDSLL